MLYFVGLVMVGLAALLLLPGGWTRSLERGEKVALRIFLGVRGVAPLVYTYIADRSDDFFSGGSDSKAYIEVGRRVAAQLDLQGYSQSHREVPGTGAIDLSMGYLFRLGGVDRLAANYLMTGLSTVGILIFWVSTRELVSAERRRIYSYLLLLAPTTAFWSASVSKEAPILLGVACISAVFFELFNRRRRLTLRIGLLFGIGVLCLGYIRPHVALLLIMAVIGATFLSSGRLALATTGQRRLLVGLVALGGLLIAIPLSEDLLGVSGNDSLIDRAYEASEQRAEGQGRAAYEAEPVRGIGDVPRALVEVLLRPYPWEIGTPMQALAALETYVYMGFLLYAISTSGAGRSRLLRHPAVVFCGLFLSLMSSALVTYGNIGLLVRQRMQIWPHLILLAFLFLASKRSSVPRQQGVGRLRVGAR